MQKCIYNLTTVIFKLDLFSVVYITLCGRHQRLLLRYITDIRTTVALFGLSTIKEL